MKRFTIAASAGLVAIAFAIAGCGGTGSPTTTGSPPSVAASASSPSANAATPSSGGSTSGGGGGAEINACSLVSAAQASSLVGNQYTAATPSTIAPGQDQCDYASATAPTDLIVIVYQASSGVTFEMLTSIQSGAGTVTNVSGVGDKAIVGPIELDVETGDRIIAVEGAGGTLTGGYSGAVAIAKAVIAALK